MSEIRANTISDAAGTGAATLTGQYAAKVWVNFNGTGTVAIRESGNMSTITDNGTGDYTLNYTSALADANYSAVGSCEISGVVTEVFAPITYSSSSLRVATQNGGSNADATYVNVTITR